jgi:hypothetical protein
VPEFVEAVAQVRDRLPQEDCVRLGILAGNYGEVGTLNLYGRKFGLPHAMSGVNSSWERGYGNPAPEVVIVVGYSQEFLEREFASCVVAGRVWNRYGVMNEETVEDPEIFVCRGLKGSWEEFWKRARTLYSPRWTLGENPASQPGRELARKYKTAQNFRNWWLRFSGTHKFSSDLTRWSLPLRRFEQEIASGERSVTFGVDLLVHSWCTLTCK